MKYELTQNNIEDYIKENCNRCPFCDSQDIDGQSWDYDEGRVSQEVICLECGGCWEDIYSLCDMRVIYNPGKPKDVKDGDNTVHN